MTKEQMDEIIAKNLCQKSDELSFIECFSAGKKSICKRSKQCRIVEKTEEQHKYILSSIHEDIFLEACPGSGKTEVVGMKAAYEINNWTSNINGIAFISFTNHAVEVINDRVDEFCSVNSKHPHFIGTLSSFIYGYISQPFGHIVTAYSGDESDYSQRIVDRNTMNFGSGWLEKYKCRIPRINKEGKSIPIYSNQIVYDYIKQDYLVPLTQFKSVYFKDLYNEDYYQDYINAIRERTKKPWLFGYQYCKKCFDDDKKKFLEDGFANFEDMNQIAYKVLTKDKTFTKLLSKRFPLIVIDECQDLSVTELLILHKLKLEGTKLHFIGDLNQSVYEFKRVDPKHVASFVSEFQQLHLTSNFRSCKQIVDVVDKIIPSKNSIRSCGKDLLADNSRLYIEYTDIEEVIDKYQLILEKCNIINGENAVIVKQNSLRKKLSNISSSRDGHLFLEAVTYWRSKNPVARKLALEKCGEQVAKWFKTSRSSLNYYCPIDVESKFYWRIFLRNVLDDCISSPIGVTSEIKYAKWYKTVREHLPSIIRNHYSLVEDYDRVYRDFDTIFSGQWFRAKDAQENISEISFEEKTQFNVMTIHASKGCTFDSTLVVSSVDGTSQSGHWKKHWIGGSGEECRIGYVALSRAKYQLVLAVPTLDEDDRELIEGMGFKDCIELLQ